MPCNKNLTHVDLVIQILKAIGIIGNSIHVPEAERRARDFDFVEGYVDCTDKARLAKSQDKK
ncbi:hypothetical protein PHLCEN_2v7755 [Hermanssonia centrifuga]|uniref:Uncharacterized protein n=1 Tax=Hermanssonia centrifuga TaxID=98765 RepID=A0A2R6NVL2_9APHY|nr:hypothetical protein PHLCEN_2v7755 [Hermanssonia centrifuga]